MGKESVKKPLRLSEKLLAIRTGLNLSQSELISRLGEKGEITQSQISAFERGARAPSLIILLRYSRLAGISTDVLIDDLLELPKKFTDIK